MSRITKAMLEANYKVGYDAGLARGREYERQQAQAQLNEQKLKAITQLINAVGQTLQAQNGIVEGLARTLDNIGGIR